ncbi:divergent polysaccharide deacetylase family protein [Pseudoalteromonas sp. SS15]|uniref:divergent polysaccharide deacetylase family protein n=1 Tax=Pseudoalteromonas sp. SS15 TaxID=3139393 RepID=UPI003BADA7BC
MRSLLWLLLSVFYLAIPLHAKQIAIVIDDVGNHQRDLNLLSLPGELTFAILPHTPYSQKFAYLASQQSKELLLHVPMQAIEDKALGPGALTLNMDKQTLQMTLGHALASLPQVSGVNNHMGSALTQYSDPMKWTMEVLRKRGLYFLDSRTTNESQAQTVADLYGVANIARQVFLDNEKQETYFTQQLNEAKSIALRSGQSVLIAHPYPETVAFLHAQIPLLLEQGYELVPLSQLVRSRYIQLAKNTGTVVPSIAEK